MVTLSDHCAFPFPLRLILDQKCKSLGKDRLCGIAASSFGWPHRNCPQASPKLVCLAVLAKIGKTIGCAALAGQVKGISPARSRGLIVSGNWKWSLQEAEVGQISQSPWSMAFFPMCKWVGSTPQNGWFQDLFVKHSSIAQNNKCIYIYYTPTLISIINNHDIKNHEFSPLGAPCDLTQVDTPGIFNWRQGRFWAASLGGTGSSFCVSDWGREAHVTHVAMKKWRSMWGLPNGWGKPGWFTSTSEHRSVCFSFFFFRSALL